MDCYRRRKKMRKFFDEEEENEVGLLYKVVHVSTLLNEIPVSLRMEVGEMN